MKFHQVRLLTTSLLLLAGGCISSNTTAYQSEKRVAVTFASEQASTTFHEALKRHQRTAARTEQRTSINLIVIKYSRRTVPGPDTYFNQAVTMCDHNRDSVISEAEAADLLLLVTARSSQSQTPADQATPPKPAEPGAPSS